MVVRLRRAGIDTDLISVLHTPTTPPNSALCWLDGASSVSLSSGETATVAGLFRLSLAEAAFNGGSSALVDRLCHLGLKHDQAMSIEESLLENRIIIMVEVTDEFELPAIFHTFRGLAAEKARTVDLNRRTPKAIHGSQRYRPIPALCHAVAAA
jgi:hypothetical protein